MFTTPCQKRRHVVRTDRDGEKRELNRCANKLAATYKSEVDHPTCEKCALTQSLLNIGQCGANPPADTEFPQPTIGEDAEVSYKSTLDATPPPCPSGYQRRIDNAWVFDPIWYPCQYRLFNNDLFPDGSLKIKAYCAASKKIVSFEECENCQGTLAKVGVSLDPESPTVPGLTSQLQTYWTAVQSWIAVGRPTRTDAEVKELHERYCSRCDWYDPESKRCKGCGCKVRPGGAALLNKIKMKTEHCPRDFW